MNEKKFDLTSFTTINVVLGQGDDHFVQDAGSFADKALSVDGGTGNDTLQSNNGVGNGVFIGGSGNDTIQTGDGNDVIVAGCRKRLRRRQPGERHRVPRERCGHVPVGPG